MSNLIINPYAFAAAAVAGAGPDGTNYYVEVTIPTTSVTASLSDFPVYVDLSDFPAAFWSHVQSDGGDIRVTQSDGSTRCAAELVSIDTGTSTGELHFLAAAISDATDTTFRIYYGHGSLSQPVVTGTYGRNAVWADYAAVYHGDDLTDSTGNGNDLTAVGGAAASSSTAKLGKAFNLDGTGDYLWAADDATLDITGPYTQTAWGRATAWDNTTNSTIFGKWDLNGARAYNMLVWNSVGSSGRLTGTFSSNGTAASQRSATSGHAPDSAWHHYAASVTPSAAAAGILLYRDGAAVSAGTDSNDSTTVNASSARLTIGDIENASAASGREWHGQLDEVRMRSGALIADWIAAEHANQSAPASFYTVGSETAA